jgi:hypothetical protein
MSRRILVLSLGLLALAPATASAATANPTSLIFGSQLVGTTSASKTVTLTANSCVPIAPPDPTCAGEQNFFVSISASGDFSQTNNCPGNLTAVQSCTITVTFSPTATGTRSGTITTGYTTNPGYMQGPAIPLTGTGFVPASMTPTPTSTPAPNLIGTTKKKCKRKRGHKTALASKKRCKKRR